MIVAAGLILGATLLAWTAPTALRRMTSTTDPATAIGYWLVSITGVLATYAAGVGLLLLPGSRPAVADLAAGCWTAIRHGRAPALDEVAGALGLVVALIIAGRFLHAAMYRRRAQQRMLRAHLKYLGVVGGVDAASARTLWLDHTQPLAYSISGRPGLVVASTGLNRLPADQLTAVLIHERAHLHGRHHLLTSLTEALAKAMPLVPLFHHAPAAVRLLVELAADAAAVRVCGPQPMRAALLALDGGHAPDQALAIAQDAVPLRLHQLAQPRPAPHAARRALNRAVAGLALLTVPGAVGVGTVVLAMTLSCHSG